MKKLEELVRFSRPALERHYVLDTTTLLIPIKTQIIGVDDNCLYLMVFPGFQFFPFQSSPKNILKMFMLKIDISFRNSCECYGFSRSYLNFLRFFCESAGCWKKQSTFVFHSDLIMGPHIIIGSTRRQLFSSLFYEFCTLRWTWDSTYYRFYPICDVWLYHQSKEEDFSKCPLLKLGRAETSFEWKST